MPPPTRLYLIRHGQSAGNAEGRFGGHGATPLSDLGRRQAEFTAVMLAKEGVSAIYASDLPRAVETADALAELINVPVNKTAAFRRSARRATTGWTTPHWRSERVSASSSSVPIWRGFAGSG